MKKLLLSDIPFEETRSPEPDGPPISWARASNRDERAAWKRFWVVQPIMGGLNYVTHHALRLLPVSASSRFGAFVAPLAKTRFAGKPFSQRIVNNFKILRPDISDTTVKLDGLVSNWWENVGRAYAEFSVTNRHWKAGLVTVSGKENLQAARSKERPMVFVSVHVGHWEAQMHVLSQVLDVSVVGPFQPEPSRFTNRLVYQLRKRRGQYFFPPRRKTAMRLHKLLRGEEASALVYIDEVRDAQIHMPLFGRPVPAAGNVVMAIKLAMSTDAVLVPVYMKRTTGAKYGLNFLPPVEPVQSGERAADVTASIKMLNDAFEPVVLDHLDQWYMLPSLKLENNGAVA